jgi:hypothetical protein
LRFENSDSILQLPEKGRNGDERKAEEKRGGGNSTQLGPKPWSMTEHIFNDPGTAVGER